MRARRSHGFTLIELMVVMVIIMILAAILFPVFAQARDKARQTVCLSNLKQITMAVLMYANDWNETLPYVPIQEGTSGGLANLLPPLDAATEGASGYDRPFKNQWDGSLWVPILMPYVKNREVWYCPSAPRDPADHLDDLSTGYYSGTGSTTNPKVWNTNPYYGKAPTNYDINAMIVMPEWYRYSLQSGQKGQIPLDDPTISTSGPVTLAMIKDPGGTMLWEDYGQAYPYGKATSHAGGTNFSACDGHVEWVRQGLKRIKAGWWYTTAEAGAYW
jgi:prepilin-type N-terminal cleavage/methylation domain-containing protein/prepilin-type processing-associated H-X9-DG protein